MSESPGSADYDAACEHDRHGREAEAIPYYERALQLGLSPTERRGALLGLGSSLRNVGRSHDAARLFREARFEFPDYAPLAAFSALSQFSAGNLPAALRTLLDLVVQHVPLDGYDRALKHYRAELGSAHLTTHHLSPDRWPDLEALFGPVNGCDGCWCMNHRITPGMPDVTGEPARLALRDAVETGQANGVLAYRGEEPVGWCGIEPFEGVPGHDCTPSAEQPAEPTWCVHCFFVKSDARGEGVSELLLAAAVELARGRGARAIWAFPTLPGEGRELFDFSGAYSIFARAGFKQRRDLGPNYSVMELLP